MSLLEKGVNITSASPIRPVDHRGNQFIQPFRNRLLARQLGVRVLTGLSGIVDIPAYSSGVMSGWVAKSGALSASDMTHAKKSMTPKHGVAFESIAPLELGARKLVGKVQVRVRLEAATALIKLNVRSLLYSGCSTYSVELEI